MKILKGGKIKIFPDKEKEFASMDAHNKNLPYEGKWP